MRPQLYIFLLLTTVMVVSCSRSFDPDVRTGATPTLIEGHPDIRMAAIGFFDEDGNPVLDVDTDIIYNSLIYKSTNDVFEAEVGIQIQVLSVKDGRDNQLVENRSYVIDVKEENRRIIESKEALHVHDRIDLEPGRYEVVVAVTDQSSGKTTRTKANASIFDPDSNEPDLTHIKVLGIESNSDKEPFPITTYNIPGDADSLSFQFYVTKPDAENEMSIDMRLIEFASDTLPPRDMSGVQPNPGSILYRGINYNNSDVIEEANRTLLNETGTILIEYSTIRPPTGNFRFQVTTNSGESELQKARDFSLKSKNYPYIENTREMARPLAYLMNRREYERMMEIGDKDSLKAAIDNFWYDNLKSVDLARRVIELYYTRVEEANKQFSSFKEGWMTDMGMVYILFGPPYYVERSLDTYIWIYGYDRGDPNRVFQFQRTRMGSEGYPFDHYILNRRRFYHTIEYQQREEWLNGTILKRSL
ncbi:MAG: GWxTD domain-containing protein [Balneolales bacterium]